MTVKIKVEFSSQEIEQSCPQLKEGKPQIYKLLSFDLALTRNGTGHACCCTSAKQNPPLMDR